MIRRFIGGPLHNTLFEESADVIELAAYPDMAYHRAKVYHALYTETAYEWHKRDWVSPEVAAIRAAVTEASERFR